MKSERVKLPSQEADFRKLLQVFTHDEKKQNDTEWKGLGDGETGEGEGGGEDARDGGK